VKRTLKKGLKVLEMVKRERNKIIKIDNSLKLIQIYISFKRKYKVVLIIFELINLLSSWNSIDNKIINTFILNR
jgi:hypothetical protein